MRVKTLAALALMAAVTPSFASETYQIDPNHTQVRFQYSHMGFSTIVGLLSGISGELVYDAETPANSRVEVNIPMSQLHTGVDKFNDHLRSADFFDVGTYPTASFTSTSVEQVGENTLKVTGELKVRDITRPVVLDVALNARKPHPASGRAAIGFDASTELKRSDLGVGLYAPAVGDEVKISITVEASVPKA